MENLSGNLGFLQGVAVWNSFFFKDQKPVLLEASYFHLMSAMRKLRIDIPMHYTEEYFAEKLADHAARCSYSRGGIRMMIYLEKTADGKEEVREYWENKAFPLYRQNKFALLDVLKEIQINGGLISNLAVHHAENRYAEVFSRENDLTDVILLNSEKKIARCSNYNLLILQGNKIRLPRSADGAMISVLMESFLGYLHGTGDFDISPESISPFETQTAEEVLLVSDGAGFLPVGKIRNKEFPHVRFQETLARWWDSL